MSIPGACFSKVPRTFRARKASCQTTITCFEKMILACFNGRKTKRIARFDGLEPRRCEDTEDIVRGTQNRPETFPDFGDTGLIFDVGVSERTFSMKITILQTW